MITETVTIPAGSTRLSGTLFLPDTAPKGVVLLSGATGIPHGYYQHFARWLTEEHSLGCLTYDYSDFGASLTGSMRQSQATMALWGARDQQAARAWLLARVPEGALTMIGHSLGGLCHNFHAPEPRLSRVIAVASGPIHQYDHPMPYRLSVMAFWHVFGPVLTTLLGYYPGKAMGLGADIPAGVFWQWRRWCTKRGFFAHDADPLLANPASLTCELRTVALADDDMIPPQVVARHVAWHPEARHSHVTLDPAAFGLQNVGHLAAFRRKNQALWPALLGLS